jgi:hypothetical protein
MTLPARHTRRRRGQVHRPPTPRDEGQEPASRPPAEAPGGGSASPLGLGARGGRLLRAPGDQLRGVVLGSEFELAYPDSIPTHVPAPGAGRQRERRLLAGLEHPRRSTSSDHLPGPHGYADRHVRAGVRESQPALGRARQAPRGGECQAREQWTLSMGERAGGLRARDSAGHRFRVLLSPYRLAVGWRGWADALRSVTRAACGSPPADRDLRCRRRNR